jgi:NAD(P)-dependent dehydrogenase (short-subunit alcohol dehydrogenase family)
MSAAAMRCENSILPASWQIRAGRTEFMHPTRQHAVWLCSDGATTYITGDAIAVDGGQTA